MQRDGTNNEFNNSNAKFVFMGREITVQGVPCPSAPAPSADGWVDLAVRSTAWRHVPADRDASFFRERVAETVAALARLRDEAEGELADDPWRDDAVVPRFAESVEWLLGEPGPECRLDLYPAEAALLVLMPFVYRVQTLRLAASLRARVAPKRLDRHPGPGPERASFEVFAEGHDLLVKRALQHPEAAEPIGWWLFHRWLALREEFSDAATVRTLWEAVGAPADALGETVDPRRICRLLHGLRRGPDVCNREYLDELPADDAAGVRGGGPQRIRDQRLALLLALAHGASREITALPQIVVEHLGIPHPVDLVQLRRTLERSRWGGSHDLPVLHAECHHEAVIEGLRAYTDRTDTLLAAVRRTARERVTQPVPALPARLSADGVTPAEDVFTGWASFRLDERRVRDLLMGVQLYRDRDLAIRELYQNALDACRYRRARTEYLDRTRDATYTYDGRIDFEQGTDDDGREYVECRDNGVGMGESELRGVFSQAGSRFVDQLDFKLERAGWAEAVPPVELFPNSRFGIGVLSYFMLADEIRVTTCRMDAWGRLGPLLRVSIYGPGHLFRIERLAERGEEAGTQVRLCLRDADERGARWSCLAVLERVLGIAEFSTEVRHGEHGRTWEARRLSARKAPDRERFGLDAHGTLVEWAEAPDGVQVIWCERGGGLLVDGLVVQPEARQGVLTARAHSGLEGVVVNLSGGHAPGRLSVDRSRILDDVSGGLRDLLVPALKSLLASDEELPHYEWICRLVESSVCLAELITKAAIDAGRVLEYEGHRIDMATTGCLPADMRVLPAKTFGADDRRDTLRDLPWMKILGEPLDHILLWRVIAHGPNAALTALAEVCPEIQDVRVRPALPSDDLLLSRSDEGRYRHWNIRDVGYVRVLGLCANMADELGISWQSAARRAEELGIRTEDRPVSVGKLRSVARFMGVGAGEAAVRLRDLGVPVRDAVVTLAVADEHDPLLLKDPEGFGQAGWLDPDETVPPGHVAKASRVLDIPVPEVCARLAAYGLRYDVTGLPDRPDARTVVLLSANADGKWPWLSHEKSIPAGQVLINSEKLGIPPGLLLAELTYLGFTTPSVFPADAHPDDARLLWSLGGYLQPGKGILYRHLFHDAGRAPQEVIDRLRAYGIDVPLKLPSAPTRLDKELFTDEPLWWGLNTAQALPYAHVVKAADMLRTEPSEVAWYLRGYGVLLARDDLPEGLTFDEALTLIKKGDPGKDLRFDVMENFSLGDLLRTSLRVGRPLSQAATWLGELGLWSGSVADAVRKALSRVPRA